VSADAPSGCRLPVLRDRQPAAVGPSSPAGDTVTAYRIHTPEPGNPLLGPIGRTVLDNLLPTARRQRVKARSRKNTTSKYAPNAGQHPQTTQAHTFTAEIHIMENGLAPRSHR
jgi:hypothetical protein